MVRVMSVSRIHSWSPQILTSGMDCDRRTFSRLDGFIHGRRKSSRLDGWDAGGVVWLGSHRARLSRRRRR